MLCIQVSAVALECCMKQDEPARHFALCLVAKPSSWLMFMNANMQQSHPVFSLAAQHATHTQCERGPVICVNACYLLCQRYPAVESWQEKFLFRLCTRMWGMLEDKGHLAINIVDRPSQQFCNAMNDHISKLPGARFKGVLQLQTAQRPQTAALQGKLVKFEPIWIWQRMAQ